LETSYSQELQSEPRVQRHPGLLLHKVHEVFRLRFWRWLGIMAPASLLSACVLLLADERIRSINRGIRRGQVLGHMGDVMVMGAVRYGSFSLTWLLGCFALAAIATVVNQLDGENEADNWRRDSYQHAREHLGSIIGIAIITFCLFLLGMVGMGFVESAAFKIFGTARFLRYNYLFWLVSYALIATVVGLLGATIPIILASDIGVRAALIKSVEMSSGYEWTLLTLVVESVLGSFLVWYLVFHGLHLLLPSALTHSPWCGWVLNLLGVLLSAAVESPLFIGFALLADPERFQIRQVA
jgi:hypothetical protein